MSRNDICPHRRIFLIANYFPFISDIEVLVMTLSFQILKLCDGGEVGLDWIDNGHKDGDKQPIVLFLPGLTGDSQSGKYFFVCVSV